MGNLNKKIKNKKIISTDYIVNNQYLILDYRHPLQFTQKIDHHYRSPVDLYLLYSQ